MTKLIFMIASELCFMYSFLLLKKSSEKQSLIVWSGITILMQYILNAILGGIYGLLKLPISCYSIFPAVLVISVFLLFINKKNGCQEYEINKLDVIFLVLLILTTLLFWTGYFRLNLLVRFVSVDASVHARFAKQIVLEHTISNNMFLPYMNDGLFMEACLFITGTRGMMHSFVFMRVLDFFVSGLAFYGIVRTYSTKNGGVSGIIITFLYLFGYPLYVLIFGFVYFGTSVTMIIGLLTICKLYSIVEEKYKYIYVLLLNCFLFSVFTTYTLFVPPIFLGVFIYQIYELYKSSNLSLLSFIRIEAKVFIVPCVFGMIYAFGNLKEMQAGSGGAVSLEGGKYFDLYSNFILLIPFALSGLVKQVKNKYKDAVLFVFFTSLSFTILLFILSLKGIVSIYYLSKMYNILWMLNWLYVFIEIESLMSKDKAFISSFGIEFVILMFLTLIRFDNKINQNKTYVISGSDNFVNIYYFNCNFLLNQGFVDVRISSTAEAIKDNIECKEDSVIFAGNEIDSNWFKTYYGKCDINGSGNVISVLEDVGKKDYTYLFYENETFSPEDIMSIQEIGEMIYSTDFATVIKLN